MEIKFGILFLLIALVAVSYGIVDIADVDRDGTPDSEDNCLLIPGNASSGCPSECIDSDGTNLQNAGYCIDANGTHNDYCKCIENTSKCKLVEYECVLDNKNVYCKVAEHTLKDCECKDGKFVCCTDLDSDGFGVDLGHGIAGCKGEFEDNCQKINNPDQADRDNDGIGDACDYCPSDPSNDKDGDAICGDIDKCPSLQGDVSTGGCPTELNETFAEPIAPTTIPYLMLSGEILGIPLVATIIVVLLLLVLLYKMKFGKVRKVKWKKYGK